MKEKGGGTEYGPSDVHLHSSDVISHNRAATAFLFGGVGARSGVTAAMEQKSGAHALLRVRDGVSAAAAAAGPAGFLGVAGILGTAALIIREL
ncbi:unnamed protein product [Sphagnum jensenii]|jgi:hypothetical protein|uniref:Uncharacterized protein n=1 Tax=Sphagnum jensenii TaxID=128206 RepID=A0ABP0WKH3_9BRYO